MSVLSLARADIRSLTPYSSARKEAQGGRVFLNANESPWPPEGDDGAMHNRYPDPQPKALLTLLAKLYKVNPTQILVGRGSDEAIDLLTRAFCRAGRDNVVICPPTFGMYAVCARIQGAGVIEVPLLAARDFMVDIDAVFRAVTPDTRLVYLCTPNNPTGGVVPLAQIAALAERLRDRALLVVDEAYRDFTDTPSAMSFLAQHDNVAVLHTLSKAHALAGARIGTLVASEEVIALLQRIIAPYPLPTACLQLALAALAPAVLARTRERLGLLRAERDALARALARLSIVDKVWPSAANFLTVRWRNAQAVYAQLFARGIVLRNVSHYLGLSDCLRISVGTPEENRQLLAALVEQAEVA